MVGRGHCDTVRGPASSTRSHRLSRAPPRWPPGHSPGAPRARGTVPPASRLTLWSGSGGALSMKISRSLFLALTGAISATPACYADAPPPQPPAPRPVVYQYAPSAYPAPPRPPVTRYYYINSEGQRVAVRGVRRRHVR